MILKLLIKGKISGGRKMENGAEKNLDQVAIPNSCFMGELVRSNKQLRVRLAALQTAMQEHKFDEKLWRNSDVPTCHALRRALRQLHDLIA